MKTALCKFRNMLVLMEVTPAKNNKGQCPDCGATEFRDAPHGWVECANECGFAILKNHLLEAECNSSGTHFEDCSDLELE